MSAAVASPLRDLYSNLALTMADLLEHPDCPEQVAGQINMFFSEIHSLTSQRAPRRCDAAQIRASLPVCLSLLADEDGEDK